MSVTEGVLPPITTPMDESGDVDHEALRAHINRLEAAGVHGIIPCGSTGERATLTREEHERVIETTVDAASTPVLAGTGASSTQEAIELSTHAADVGADGVLVIYPYYSWPANDHVVRHYEAIADAVDVPLVIYNIPKRTARNLEPDATVRLADHPNIAGIKESAGDINQMYELLQRTRDKEFDVLSGYDSQALSTITLGGTGITSVAANVFPETVCELYDAARTGDLERGRELHEEILELESAMNLQTIPIAVKAALDIVGVHGPHVRPPLYEADPETREELESFLADRNPA
ncbi:4-hydroxy-tetrahydrodipicolinate synthase [Halorarius halobius]|uniref:4-hydroxy-tetrahydrodipicolinate synthase n=1 Tax=Halorarius halobius TaxID=2962671 RepID=UPI0020CD45F0|nr:4-hydroxy-tetrahydrodipicolinate synthase [Halorarius halobius]